MNVASVLVTIVCLALGAMVLLPVLTLGLALLVAAAACLLWLLPILIIAASDQTSGWEKAAWLLAIIFLSWFAWILYFFLAPLKPRERYHGERYYY